MPLWHITSRSEWEAAQRAGEYRAPSLPAEGFIHLSSDQQWPLTLKRFFAGKTNLVLLRIREDRLAAPVRWESADADTFPHLYGPLNLDAVEEVVPLGT